MTLDNERPVPNLERLMNEPDPFTDPPTHRKTKPSTHYAFIVGIIILALTLVGATVKMVTDAQEADRLNASITALTGENGELTDEVTGLEADNSSLEGENTILSDDLAQAEVINGKYRTCTKGLLGAIMSLAKDQYLVGPIEALAKVKAVQGACKYALNANTAGGGESV